MTHCWSKLAALVLSIIACPFSWAEEEHTFKKYDQILAEKPVISGKHVKVWSVRQTSSIRINLVEFSGEIPLHKHPDADHSLLVLEGQVEVQVADKKFVASKGDFISVPANVPHKYRTLGKKAVLVSMDAPYYNPKKTIRLE